jgi:hypothetical protein
MAYLKPPETSTLEVSYLMSQWSHDSRYGDEEKNPYNPSRIWTDMLQAAGIIS